MGIEGLAVRSVERGGYMQFYESTGKGFILFPASPYHERFELPRATQIRFHRSHWSLTETVQTVAAWNRVVYTQTVHSPRNERNQGKRKEISVANFYRVSIRLMSEIGVKREYRWAANCQTSNLNCVCVNVTAGEHIYRLLLLC